MDEYDLKVTEHTPISINAQTKEPIEKTIDDKTYRIQLLSSDMLFDYQSYEVKLEVTVSEHSV